MTTDSLGSMWILVDRVTRKGQTVGHATEDSDDRSAAATWRGVAKDEGGVRVQRA